MASMARPELLNDSMGNQSMYHGIKILRSPSAHELLKELGSGSISQFTILLPGDVDELSLGEDLLHRIEKFTEPHFGIFSSGTTGKPKMHLHSLSKMMSGTNVEHPGRTWGMLYGADRMAGLQVIFQVACSGTRLSEGPANAAVDELLKVFSSDEVDSLSATPSRWRQILAARNRKKLKLKHISIGGEIVTQDLLDDLKTEFPDAKITHIYATTESGPTFAVSDGVAGFPESFLDRQHRSGVVPSILNGELILERFTPEGRDNPIATGDLVEKRGSRIHFIGRKDDIVNIGGSKISLNEIEEEFMKLGLAVDCKAKAQTNSILGEVIYMDVIWKDKPVSDSEVRKALKDNLPRYAMPAVINTVEEISYSPNHKKMRS